MKPQTAYYKCYNHKSQQLVYMSEAAIRQHPKDSTLSVEDDTPYDYIPMPNGESRFVPRKPPELSAAKISNPGISVGAEVPGKKVVTNKTDKNE